MFSPDSSEFRKFWTEDRIDRSFAVNSHRLIIGIDVAKGWRHICGSLVVAQGRGKFLQIRHSSELSVPVPEELTSRLRDAANNKQKPMAGVLQLSQDLADCQAQLVSRLSGEAGKYVDRILGVSVTDPGWWANDFDGAQLHIGASDPVRLAELTGLNVIDEFPRRDLAAGGSGVGLDALPFWFLFADRQIRGATGSCLVLDLRNPSRWYLLPESDGLDEIQPAIQSEILNSSSVDGNSICQCLSRIINDSAESQSGDLGQHLPICELVLISTDEKQDILLEDVSVEMKKNFPNIAFNVIKPGANGPLVTSRLTAILGLLYIDQVPQNVPQITGASGLRILGRLTPGKPFSFRNLLNVMADNQANPMRLRDAI